MASIILGSSRSSRRIWHGDLIVGSTGGVRQRAIRRALGLALAAYAACLPLVAGIDAAPTWFRHCAIAWDAPLALLLTAFLQGAAPGYFLAFGVRRVRGIAGGAIVGGVVGLAAVAVSAVTTGSARFLVWPVAALGGAVGAAAFLRILRRARAQALNEYAVIAPDLPLVGGVYLLTPVVWLVAGDAGRELATWTTLALGLYGASLIASARASRGAAGGGPGAHAALAIAWFVCSAAPLLVAAPTFGILATWGVGAFAAAHQPLLGARGRERRMEIPALRRALPILGLALLLIAAAPAHGSPFAGVALELGVLTIVGYAAGELRGRNERPGGVTWTLVRRWTVPLALVMAGARVVGYDADVASMIDVAALAIAGIVGARLGVAIYCLQRAHVRAYAGERGRVRTLATAVARARRDGRFAPPRMPPDASRGGYIRRSCPPNTAQCSTRAPCSAPSSAWRTRSSS